MSIRLMTLVWDVRWPTQNHLLVMLKLADHANDDGGKVWPAVATIALQAQCSERTVQNVLKALRDCGLATVTRPGGGSQPTVYALNVDLLRALAGKKLEGSADRIEIPDEAYSYDIHTGATVAPPVVAPVQPATERGANEGGRGAKLLHPNHHLEPSRETSLSEVSNFDLKSEGAKPSKALPCFTITPADTSWEAWLEHFRQNSHRSLAYDATQKKRIRVSTRWPKPESIVFEPQIKKPVKDFTGSEDAA